MSHSYTYCTSVDYSSYIIDIYISEGHEHDHDLDTHALYDFLSILPVNYTPKQITNRIFDWSSKILKLDVKDSNLNILLITEVDPEIV